MMGQSLCKRNKNPHRKKKKKKKEKRAFAPSPVHTPLQFSSAEPQPQNNSGYEEWLIFIAGILRGLTGATPQSSAASHRKEQLLTRNSRASGRVELVVGEHEDLP